MLKKQGDRTLATALPSFNQKTPAVNKIIRLISIDCIFGRPATTISEIS